MARHAPVIDHCGDNRLVIRLLVAPSSSHSRLGKDGNVAFAEQLSKTGLATALDVYGDDEEHPDYKRLAGLYGWLTTMGDAGDNPVGDIMGTFM